MAIEGLRYGLMMALLAAVVWVAAGAWFDATPQGVSRLPGASLCIHRPVSQSVLLADDSMAGRSGNGLETE